MSTPRYRQEVAEPRICTVGFSWQFFNSWGLVSSDSNIWKSSPVTPRKTQMWDQLTPGFFRLKAQNAILPVNVLRKEKTSVSFTAGESRLTETSQWGNTLYCMNGDGLVLAGPWGNIVPSVGTSFSDDVGPSDAEKQQTAIAAVANARQDLLDGMTFLAELEKTLDMFKTCVNRYTQRLLVVEKNARVAYRTLRRGSFGPASSLSFADVFASTWMEYRYGWTPLSYDITAMYNQLLELEALFHRVRNSSEKPAETVTQTTSRLSGRDLRFQYVYSTGPYFWQCETAEGTEYSTRATALLELTNSFRVTCDPLLSGYELVPYSWMADWFLNIGDLLRTFSPFALGELKSCSVTSIKTNYVRSRLVPPALPTGFQLDNHTAATGAVEFTQTHRVPIKPEITFDLRAELNVYRLLDALSLLIGKSSRLMRALASIRD